MSTRTLTARASPRRGAAIAAVVVMLLAMQVLAHGVLLGALQELAATRAAVYLVQSRWVANGAVLRAMGVPLGIHPDSVPVGEARPLDEARNGRAYATLTAERLSSESWLLRGRGAVDGWAGSVSSARLAWVLDPVTRVASFSAVVHQGTPGPAGPGGQITTDVLPDSMSHSLVCSPWFAALDSMLSASPPPAFTVDTTEALRLGRLDADALATLATDEAFDSVTPMPIVRLGRCTEALDNWGDPLFPYGACGGRFVFRRRQGGFRIQGGVGQGVLIVTDDLVLDAGADFRGLILVGGSLRLEQGSRFQGLARVGGAVQVSDSSRIAGSACWAVRSLAGVQDRLRVTMPYPGWGWLTSM